MRLLHIVAGVPPGGGMAESVPALCRNLRMLGHDVTLATLDGVMSEAALMAERDGVRMIRFPSAESKRLYFSWQMLQRMGELCKTADVVHVHGAWTFPVWWGGYCAIRAKMPLVRSPRGCFAPERLKRSALKKRLAGCIFERRLLQASAVVHVTCEAEAEEVRGYCCGKAEDKFPAIDVVPNGIAVDAWSGERNRDAIDQRWPVCRGKRVVLFLGRIDPIKGLDMLAKAWRRVCPDTGWHLLVVGEGEKGYTVCIRDVFECKGADVQVTFGGAVYGDEKRAVMRAADVFILPTYNENFGIAAAEALAAGVPVITTKGAPWEDLVTEHCGWWVDVNADALAEALQEALGLTDGERRAMGVRGRRLVERKYQWKTIAEQMAQVYQKVCAGKHGG